MPNITDMKYRSLYQLYDDKPCINESSDACLGCLYNRITLAGETIGHHEWGDSPRFRKKQILCVQSKIACK
jgi:biotin synthase